MGDHKRIAVLMIVLLSFSMVSGCLGLGDIADAINKAVLRLIDPTYRALEILDDAIAQLGYESADWQRILEETREKLIKEGHTLVANDLSNTLNRAIATSGGEVRCDMDFLRQRVLQDLLRIRATLTNSTIDPRQPTICQVVPDHVDMNLDPNHKDRIRVSFYGYDFDAEPRPQVFLYNDPKAVYLGDRFPRITGPQVVVGSGQRPAGLSDKFVDVSDKLSITHHYQMVLNLGENGVPLSETSNRIILTWGNTTLSDVPVVQPHPPKCEESTATISPPDLASISLIPLAPIEGDYDFAGCGPWIDGSIRLFIDEKGEALKADVSMSAAECYGNKDNNKWTFFQRSAILDFYYAPVGYKIRHFVGQDTYTIPHTWDGDPGHHPIVIKPGGLIQDITIVGDTEGADLSKTGIQGIDFNPIQVTSQQIQYCIP